MRTNRLMRGSVRYKYVSLLRVDAQNPLPPCPGGTTLGREMFQAIIPPPSGDTWTGQPFVPDKVRYPADPTAFSSIDY